MSLHPDRTSSTLLLDNALAVCCVPLRLTRDLVDELVATFVPGINSNTVWEYLLEQGLLSPLNDREWYLRDTRDQRLVDLESKTPDLAVKVHTQVLEAIGKDRYPTDDGDEELLLKAYHATPQNPVEGMRLYFRTYCQARVKQRPSTLQLLAQLASSQEYWLGIYCPEIALFRAAALYWQGGEQNQEETEKLLQIAQKSDSVAMRIDAACLLGMLYSRPTDASESEARLMNARKHFKRAVELRADLPTPLNKDEDADVQRHLRWTLARAHFRLADISRKVRGKNQEQLDKDSEQAAYHLRWGLQLLNVEEAESFKESDPETAEIATQLRALVELSLPSSSQDEIKGQAQQIDRIERPFRQRFLQEALAHQDDVGPLYYAISAFNHGLGYDRQLIKIDIASDGSAKLSGLFTLQTMSVLARIDTYLETPLGTGVQYTGLELVSPKSYDLSFERKENDKLARLEVKIEPPLQPGEQFTYRWMAEAQPKTFAVTQRELEKASLPNEYASWQIIVPMRRLEIEVSLPIEPGQQAPAAWFTLRNMGPSPALAQTQMAYQAFLEEHTGQVSLQIDVLSVDRVLLRLIADYPRLAMRYVVAWKPW